MSLDDIEISRHGLGVLNDKAPRYVEAWISHMVLEFTELHRHLVQAAKYQV
jgi:hypothetical protein